MEYTKKIVELIGGSDKGHVFYTFARYPDGQKKFLYLSQNFAQFSDVSVETILSDYTSLFAFVKPEVLREMNVLQETSYLNLDLFYYELELFKADASCYWLSIKSIPEKLDDGTVLWSGIISDMTSVKRQAQEIEKMNKELQLLNTVNDLILNCSDQEELFQKICNALVENGQYRMAWIGKKPEAQDPDQSLRVLAEKGTTAFKQAKKMDLTDPELQNAPSIRAIHSGETIITNNIKQSNYFKPWLDSAQLNQISSSAVFPFVVNASVFILNVYSGHFDAFMDHERCVLERIAKNLALKVGKLRGQSENRDLNTQLRDNLRVLKTLNRIQEVFQTEYFIDDCLQRIVALIPAGLQFPQLCRVDILYDGQVYSAGSDAPAITLMSKRLELSNLKALEIDVSFTAAHPEGEKLAFTPDEHELIINILRGIKLFANELLLVANLKQTEANLKAVFENTDVAFVLLDLEGVIISSNHEFMSVCNRLLQIDCSKGMNINLMEALNSESYKVFKNHFTEAVKNRSIQKYETATLIDGLQEYFIVNISPVLDKDALNFICVTIKEITDIKHSEIESKRMTNDLIVRNRDLEQFSFMVSHNLRAPVLNIIGLCSHLKEDLDKFEFDYVVESINTSTERVVTVIDDLNSILMVKKDEYSVLENIELSRVLNELVDYFKRVEERRQPDIEIDLTAISSLHSSAPFVESILYNLMANAIKYSKRDTVPKLKIWTELIDQKISIHVKDQGVGINLEKDGNKLFKLYTQLNKDIKGKGLGLYMVKTQVQLLNGEINVKSELGIGTEFIVTLPLRENQIALGD